MHGLYFLLQACFTTCYYFFMNGIISVLLLVLSLDGCIRGTGFLLQCSISHTSTIHLQYGGSLKRLRLIVLAAMVSVSLYANLSRAETVINLSVIMIPLIFIFIVFLQFTWKELVWTNLFPVGESTGGQWLKGLLKAQIAFMGIELFLFFRRYVDIKEKIKGFPLFVYQMMWMSFFFFSVILTLLYFTISGLESIPEPLLYILKSQEMTFIERLDLFFLYIWMIWSIITVAIISFSALYVHRLHANEHHTRDTIIWHVLLVVLPLFICQKSM